MKKVINIFFTFFFLYSFSQNNPEEGTFAPEPGQYIVSGWVKEIHPQQVTGYTSYFTVKVENVANPLSINFYTVGNVIDGWQRIVGVLEIPSLQGATATPFLRVEMHCNNASGGDCYFDDIRFYPFNGNMKSFVYDEETQRLMAELDENNYATFYEYDLEGGLIRVKKETERGVYTIQETRSNNPKRDE
ncbi:hypothetical protein NHF50_09975 [Flavobacterium sp. NRK F10]|uniref:hypothetical protein n=1 Tax=Flavobacterium sp. NRK F10 TaxID=2954931 RepID=UPI002090BE63|nr:hypothetical protein [Flavobacterium sp. NRK F10]MCO6175370.1 hypothetical protein [Flavobacterium sp. NRK F10]